MKYVSFDRIEIVYMQGDLRAVAPPVDPSVLLPSLCDVQASRYAPRQAEWIDMWYQTVHIS